MKKKLEREWKSKFAVRLKDARDDLELNQAQLAKKCGIDSGAICRYENEQSIPSLYIAAKIAKGLRVELDYLAGTGEWKGT